MNFKKIILKHKTFYIAKYTKYLNDDFLIFIHGGPGSNCGTIEYLIDNDHLFDTLNYNIIIYDQRNCGRSLKTEEDTLHMTNVDDLYDISQHLIKEHGINIRGYIGHSYGAKLLFDFYRKFDNKIPGIFVSTARSIITPRLNNLLFDLAYLKKTNSVKYKKILFKMDDLTTNKLWELTEELATTFKKNKDRNYLYWADMDIYKNVQKIYGLINLPVNEKTFISVRKDLYSTESNFSVDIGSLDAPHLWINGFQDVIMNGQDAMPSKNDNTVTFYKSSHYPHIEENLRFCDATNKFIHGIGG